ncbi:glycosyltransferase family 1 protein [Pedobacter aquatilis]|uniref:glycosyltransferase family 4 protein n=1 Tax=Pedobacter aquatilis TaxID=351343 RepID=UPI00293169AF|nr:glycosyltransferase family 1 protein [Pedobacter aquatilis]
MAKPIIVGIDIRDLKIAKTGTKTYLEEICKAFKKGKEGFEFRFFDSPFPVYRGRNKILKITEHLRFLLWKQVSLPILALINGCDIVFCTDFFVPYLNLGYKTIPVFHDAFFWEYPEHYNRYWLKIFHKTGVKAANKSAYIVTPTAYARERVIHFSGINPDKIVVIGEAPKTFVKNNFPTKGQDGNLKTNKYFLHIGTFEKRKNLTYLVETLYRLRTQGFTDYSLILCGQISPKNDMDGSRKLFETIEEYKLKEYVIMPGYVKDEDLAAYYQNAELYLFPSINEGFGLPILEAFQHNLPVLVANNTCLPEVGGNAVITFDPYNPEDLAKKIKYFFVNPNAKSEMIEKGKERLKFFSWDKTADELCEIFRKAII